MGRKFDYPADVKTDKEKKKFREKKVRKYPEELFTEEELNTYNIFFTDSIALWDDTLCRNYKNIIKTPLEKGHKLQIFEDGRARSRTDEPLLTIHLYTKGTVLVQGNKVKMETFENEFSSFKAAVDQKRKPVTTTSSSSAPQSPHSSDNQLNETMAQLNLNSLLSNEGSPIL